MQEKEVNLLYRAGVFKRCKAAPIAMSRGWTLEFITREDEVITLNLQRSKGEREFKSLDGAAAVAKRIGFEWLDVQLGDMKWQERV